MGQKTGFLTQIITFTSPVTEKSFHLLTLSIHKIGSRILSLLTTYDMNQVIFCKKKLNTVNAEEKEMPPNLKIIHFELIYG